MEEIKNWYSDKLEKINKLSRVMTDKQLANYFNLSISEIERVLYQVLKINSTVRINNLSKDEVIQIYQYVLNGDRDLFPRKFFNNMDYCKILLKYLIDDILQWNQQDILNNLNTSLLSKYRLYGLGKNKKFIELVNLINDVYNTDYKIWQFKKSNVSDYFSDKNHIKEAQVWFKDKLLINKNITNIYEAYKHGLTNLVREYDIYGLVQKKFNSNYFKFYEEVFNEKLDIEFYNKNNYPFEISLTPISLNNKGIIYELTDEYYNLNDIGKTLINYMIKYCEMNHDFPILNNLLVKDGYISYTYYQKYFGSMENIKKYIYPLDIKPEIITCKDCGKEMPFTDEFFTVSKHDRYGLLYQCKKCNSKMTTKKLYKNYGIIFNDITDIDPIQWWKYSYTGKIIKLPDFCFTTENIIKILRYVFIEKLKLTSKDSLLNPEKYKVSMNTDLKINGLYDKFSSKQEMLTKCFPEYNLTDEDFNIYNDKNTNKLINEWIEKNNLSVLDLLTKSTTRLFDKKMENMYVTRFSSVTELFLWYFNYNNIKHPNYNTDITIYDFRQKPWGFWEDKNHRIVAIRNYCENTCEISINEVKYNNNLLKKWVKKYFNQQNICKLFPYSKYVDSLYDLLVESYPEINEENLLFDWEWHLSRQTTKESAITSLRELVLYRMNKLILNIKEDLPKYLNNTYIKYICPKFNNYKNKHFNSYYEWACLTFPEYNDYWLPENFDNTYAFDGVKCDSIQEKIIYECIKRDLGYKYIISTGNKHKGKHIIKVDKKIYGFGKCCPDFIIECVEINNKIIKLKKPIYIEYYGMFYEQHNNDIFIRYVKKAKLKNKIYKSRKDIIFIDLYPEDLKHNLQGVKDKFNTILNSNNINQNQKIS